PLPAPRSTATWTEEFKPIYLPLLASGRRIPLLASPRGGVAERSLKPSRSILFSRGRGGVPFVGARNTTPAVSIRKLRTIFLTTQVPLLAVMRGGEPASFKVTPLKPHASSYDPRERPRNRLTFPRFRLPVSAGSVSRDRIDGPSGAFACG